MVAPLQQPPLEEDIESIFLYDNRLCVVVGVKSRWARCRHVTLADLIGESWCLPPVETATGAVFFNAIHASGLSQPRVVVSSAAHQLYHRMLADGRFVGVSSTITLHFDPERPALKELPIDLPAPNFPIAILTLKNRTILPIGQLFINCALDVVRPLTKRRAKLAPKGK